MVIQPAFIEWKPASKINIQIPCIFCSPSKNIDVKMILFRIIFFIIQNDDVKYKFCVQ